MDLSYLRGLVVRIPRENRGSTRKSLNWWKFRQKVDIKKLIMMMISYEMWNIVIIVITLYYIWFKCYYYNCVLFDFSEYSSILCIKRRGNERINLGFLSGYYISSRFLAYSYFESLLTIFPNDSKICFWLCSITWFHRLLF